MIWGAREALKATFLAINVRQQMGLKETGRFRVVMSGVVEAGGRNVRGLNFRGHNGQGSSGPGREVRVVGAGDVLSWNPKIVLVAGIFNHVLRCTPIRRQMIDFLRFWFFRLTHEYSIP